MRGEGDRAAAEALCSSSAGTCEHQDKFSTASSNPEKSTRRPNAPFESWQSAEKSFDRPRFDGQAQAPAKVGSRGLATPFQPCRRKEGAEGIVARQARSATCPKAAASGKRKLWGTTDDLAPAARTCRRAPAKRS